MKILTSWKSNDFSREFSFTHTKTYEGAWLCTLVVHDGCESHVYITSTNKFIGTLFNNKEQSTDISVSMFIVDICSGKLNIFSNKSYSSPINNKRGPIFNLRVNKKRNYKKRNYKNSNLRRRLFSPTDLKKNTISIDEDKNKF